ncbi:MAG: bifunctional adenosylcobinamide kinase/adenosylcobinamide-phosphate guanylyltransferase [Clostridia bacterium]|nr:bifunctional adenosylcobinamide kinase/adenosylcobinamide-phosphate guanylyltransferase [Clostridia bacterium]
MKGVGGMSGGLVLVTGGARSGKSRFAENLAAASGRQVVYVATAVAGDEEMRLRIEQHRRRRPPEWKTVEEPRHLARVMVQYDAPDRVLLVDCMAVYLSNLLLDRLPRYSDLDEDAFPLPGRKGLAEAIEAEIGELVRAVSEAKSRIIAVTNEVGWGLEPAYPLGRAYREWLGWTNRRLAEVARAVYLVVCGLPVELKGRSVEARWEDGSP